MIRRVFVVGGGKMSSPPLVALLADRSDKSQPADRHQSDQETGSNCRYHAPVAPAFGKHDSQRGQRQASVGHHSGDWIKLNERNKGQAQGESPADKRMAQHSGHNHLLSRGMMVKEDIKS